MGSDSGQGGYWVHSNVSNKSSMDGGSVERSGWNTRAEPACPCLAGTADRSPIQKPGDIRCFIIIRILQFVLNAPVKDSAPVEPL